MANLKAEVWRPRFLEALKNSCNVRASCLASGISRDTAYYHREHFPAFAQEWDKAIEDGVDVLEAEAWTRARKNSDLLLIFLLKAYRPEKYRETIRQEYTGVDGKPVKVQIDALDEIIRRISSQAARSGEATDTPQLEAPASDAATP